MIVFYQRDQNKEGECINEGFRAFLGKSLVRFGGLSSFGGGFGRTASARFARVAIIS